MDGLDVIHQYIARLPRDTTIKRGVAQVIAAMTRTIQKQGLWSAVWEDMHVVQGQRKDRPTVKQAVQDIGKSWNRVKSLLLEASEVHKA